MSGSRVEPGDGPGIRKSPDLPGQAHGCPVGSRQHWPEVRIGDGFDSPVRRRGVNRALSFARSRDLWLVHATVAIRARESGGRPGGGANRDQNGMKRPGSGLLHPRRMLDEVGLSVSGAIGIVGYASDPLQSLSEILGGRGAILSHLSARGSLSARDGAPRRPSAWRWTRSACRPGTIATSCARGGDREKPA